MAEIEGKRLSKKDRGSRRVTEPTRGHVRRSSSLGRLGDSRFTTSLSLVEIDIDGGDGESSTDATNLPSGCSSNNNDLLLDRAAVHEAAVRLRRSSSFRRRPSLPRIDIITDFGRTSPPIASSEVKTPSSNTGTGFVSSKISRDRDLGLRFSKSSHDIRTTTCEPSTFESVGSVYGGGGGSFGQFISRDQNSCHLDLNNKSSCALVSTKTVDESLRNSNQQQKQHDLSDDVFTTASSLQCSDVTKESSKVITSDLSVDFPFLSQIISKSDKTGRKIKSNIFDVTPLHDVTGKSPMVKNRESNNSNICVDALAPKQVFHGIDSTVQSRNKPTTNLPISGTNNKMIPQYNSDNNADRKSPNSNRETARKSTANRHQDFNRKRSSSHDNMLRKPLTQTHEFYGRKSPLSILSVNTNSHDIYFETNRRSADVTSSSLSRSHGHMSSFHYDVGGTSPSTISNGLTESPSNVSQMFLSSDGDTDAKSYITFKDNISRSSEGISHVLEAAIEQMDDIIASNNNSFDLSYEDDSSLSSHSGGGVVDVASRLISHASEVALSSQIAGLVKDLCDVLQSRENPDDLKKCIPRDSLILLRDWLMPDVDEMFSMVNVRSQHSEETIRRLEDDRHSLNLQVSVLTDQVEAQADKIREMEMLMEEDKRRIMDANDILQQELLSRSHLESHKLELMSEVSGLKMRLASAEKERRELEERCRAAQRQAAELEAKLVMKDAENSELRMRLSRNGTLPLDTDNTETEKLKRAVDTLMLANEEKERKMEDLRRLLRRYRRVEEILIQAQGRKAVEELLSNVEDGDTSSNSSSTTPSVGDPNLRDQQNSNSNHLSVEDRTDGRHYISSPSATSTPVHQPNDGSRLNSSFHGTGGGSAPPVLSMGSNSRQAMGLTRSNSCENLVPGSAKTSSGSKGDNNGGLQGRGGGLVSPGYGTLPKQSQHQQQHHHLLPNYHHHHHHRNEEGGIAMGATPVKRGSSSRGPFHGLGRTLMRVRSGKRSCSAPNLAHSEVVTDDEDGLQHFGHGHGEYKKRRGLRRLFGKLKRSSSQDLEGSRDRRDGGSGDFKRGGVRATATARLAWNRDVKGRISTPDIPFARWDTDRITAWLNDIGLNMYLVDCKRWVRNGEQLLRCSQNDLEKELGMKNSLHRKKLTLAMQSVTKTRQDTLEELDHNFVARWLDDIGLPQYKDSFYDARVDARMLNSLTVEDLFNLKVSNEVHHVSIRRGIQALRLNNFNPNALRRRPAPEEHKHMESIPGEVVLWTNHRVMEWLRTIDLSEYAPNLRGSGVHGALMVLEPRFNSELFAILLSIPPSKTLLRRHLNSHFISLIGSETQQRKREVQAAQGFVPLHHNNKIKKGKFGLFSHKRSRSEPEMDSLICPPDLNGYHNNGKVQNEKAAKEIGAYSQEINSLTTMLAHERFMDSAKTSNV